MSSSINPSKYHNASSFYLFCKEYGNGLQRNFRNEAQAFESGALAWNKLSDDEKKDLKRRLRSSKDADLSVRTKHRIRNGSRGDHDTYTLGLLRDLELKRQRDLTAVVDSWTFKYCNDKMKMLNHKILLINVNESRDGSVIGVVEFSLRHGVIDEFWADLPSDQSADAREKWQEMCRRIFSWPSKINAAMNKNSPTFFTFSAKLRLVFDTMTLIAWKGALGDESEADKAADRFCLAYDIADITSLEDALEEMLKNDTFPSVTGEAVDANGRSNTQTIAPLCLVVLRAYVKVLCSTYVK